MNRRIRRLLALTLALMCAWMPALALETEAEKPILISRMDDPDAPWPFAEDAELLEVWFPQMINCDTALIRCGGEDVLIDCASKSYAKRLLILLDGLGVSSIRTIYNSHPHHDHLLGFDQVAAHVAVGELAVCFPEDENERIIEAVQAAEARNVPVTHFADGDVLRVGGAEITVFLRGDEGWSLNNRSAMMRLQFGQRTMLFTADMEKQALVRAVEDIDPALLKADIMKYPHHGLTLLTDEFAAAVSPLLCIVTNNTRPSKTYYDLRLRKLPYTITSRGYTHLVTDGETWFAEIIPADEMIAAQKAYLADPQSVTTWSPSK